MSDIRALQYQNMIHIYHGVLKISVGISRYHKYYHSTAVYQKELSMLSVLIHNISMISDNIWYIS